MTPLMIPLAAIVAVLAWGLTMIHVSGEIDKIAARKQEEIDYWKIEAASAKTYSAQVTRDKAAWLAGCRQGRADVISIMPLIMAACEQNAGLGAVAGDLAEHG